jgi:hypothetical protein
LFAYVYGLTGNSEYLDWARKSFRDGMFYYAQTNQYINPNTRSRIGFIEGTFPGSHTKVHGWIGRTNQVYLYTEWLLQAADMMIFNSFLPNGTVDQDYNTGLQVVNGTGPFRWQLVSGSLPEGLTLSNDGKISGTPGQVGTYKFTVKVTDSSSPAQEATKDFSIQIQSLPPTITTTSLPNGTEGQGYHVVLQASGGTLPLTWKVVSGSLPAGLTLSGGEISGTPSKAGKYTFTVKVTDASSPAREAAKDLSLQIDAIASPPVAEGGGPYYGQAGNPITLDASGSYDQDGVLVLYEWDVDGDSRWDISTDKATISHTWSSAYGGVVNLRVTDNDGLTATDTTSVVVTAPPLKGDLDGDGDIDLSDYQVFRSALGKCKGQQGYNPDADYDGDGCITFADYRIWYGYYKSRK